MKVKFILLNDKGVILMNAPSQKPSNTTTNTIATRTASNTKKLALWTGLWLISLALVAFGPKFLWDFHTVITYTLIVTNLFMGYKMIIANKEHLEGLDELQQRIHLEAMALSLGCSVVFGAVFGLLENVRIIASSPNPSSVLFVTGITYGIGMLIAHKKYL
jgi:hypothetical protein